MTDDDPLLSVRGLEKHYPINEGFFGRQSGVVRAVDGVSFDVHGGEALGIVGESGCGKSTTATTVIGLEDATAGDVYLDGERVADFDRSDRRAFRRRVSMMFQDPDAAFDPRMTVGESVGEPLEIHGLANRSRRREVVADLLPRVGLDAADVDRYPHELSGGQKQRAALARALILNPDLLIADEPVSALDVSVQAQILSLLDDLRTELGLSMLLISHDLGVVRQVCDRVAVMYLGEIVEVAETEALFSDPKHPYTEALIGSIPQPDPGDVGDDIELTGDVPDPSEPPAGCRFHPRCPKVIPPDEYAFEGGVWRAVLDLQLGLAGADSDDLDPGELREEYGVPAELSDPDAERVLGEALSRASNDPSGAADRLAEAFETPCRASNPGLESIEQGHAAACYLHEPVETATPESERPPTDPAND